MTMERGTGGRKRLQRCVTWQSLTAQSPLTVCVCISPVFSPRVHLHGQSRTRLREPSDGTTAVRPFGETRHRSEVVEYRVEQHRKRLDERVAALSA